MRFVDVYPVRFPPGRCEILVLRRSAPGRCPGAWEVVHGRIEPEERPLDAALRELVEETGLRPSALYNLSRVESFYLHRTDDVALIPAFAAVVGLEARVELSGEHDASQWLTSAEAAKTVVWPRERRAILDLEVLLDGGHAGPLEDVLRMEP